MKVPANFNYLGYWDCLAPYEMGMGLSAEHRAEVEAARDLWVHTGDALPVRVDVPRALVDLGTVRVNAFVDPRAALRSPELWLDRGDPHGARTYLRSIGRAPPEDPELLRLLWIDIVTREHIAAVRARILGSMVSAMTDVAEVIWGPVP